MILVYTCLKHLVLIVYISIDNILDEQHSRQAIPVWWIHSSSFIHGRSWTNNIPRYIFGYWYL